MLVVFFPVQALAQANRVERWDWEWQEPLGGLSVDGEYAGKYAISATPSKSLVTDEIKIVAEGFGPGQLVAIRAIAKSKGETWKSAAIFSADRNGTIDLSRDAPEAGSMYRGVDCMGLFRSLRPTKGFKQVFGPNGAEYTVKLQLVAADRNLDETIVTRLKRDSDVRVEEVKRKDWIGELYFPSNIESAPGIVVIGGSEGGIPSRQAEQFASKGIVALAVGYWHVGHLPQRLARIPLEAFDEAFDYIRAHESTDSKRIAVFGESRGSEAALLLACNRNDVAAVIAKVPSSIVGGAPDQSAAAWTRQSKDLPWQLVKGNLKRDGGLRGVYLRSAASATDEMVIPVEKMSAPLLLVSGTKDATWPSSDFADLIVERLQRHNYGYTVQNEKLVDAGHHIRHAIQPPVHHSTGGSREANARGARRAWLAELSFLRTHLAPDRPAKNRAHRDGESGGN